MIRRLKPAIARHLERRAFAGTAQMLGASPRVAWALACDLIQSPGDLRMAERLILDALDVLVAQEIETALHAITNGSPDA